MSFSLINIVLICLIGGDMKIREFFDKGKVSLSNFNPHITYVSYTYRVRIIICNGLIMKSEIYKNFLTMALNFVTNKLLRITFLITIRSSIFAITIFPAYEDYFYFYMQNRVPWSTQ